MSGQSPLSQQPTCVVSVLRLPTWITMLAPKITAAPAANSHGLAICAPNRNNNPNAATGATKNTALMLSEAVSRLALRNRIADGANSTAPSTTLPHIDVAVIAGNPPR